MGIVVKSKDSAESREPVPPGNYLGLITGVFDIGTQESQYGAKRQIIVTFELHKRKGPALDSKGNPFTLSNFYPLTFSSMAGKKSNLRRDVEAILGRTFSDEEARETGFDVEDLVGMACRLQIAVPPTEDGKPKGRPKITSIMALDEEDDKPKSDSDELYYELDPALPIPDGIPKWVVKQIEKSAEWTNVHGKPKADAGRPNAMAGVGAGAGSDDEDDIPF